MKKGQKNKFSRGNFFPKNRKGENLLTENIIFIILNLIFFTILILFIFNQANSAALKEEEMAKQAALLIDSAKPGMILRMNVEDALSKASDAKYSQKILFASGNAVTAKLRSNGGYSYSFFNNVDVSIFPDTSSNPVKDYIIVVNNYK